MHVRGQGVRFLPRAAAGAPETQRPSAEPTFLDKPWNDDVPQQLKVFDVPEEVGLAHGEVGGKRLDLGARPFLADQVLGKGLHVAEAELRRCRGDAFPQVSLTTNAEGPAKSLAEKGAQALCQFGAGTGRRISHLHGKHLPPATPAPGHTPPRCLPARKVTANPRRDERSPAQPDRWPPPSNPWRFLLPAQRRARHPRRRRRAGRPTRR